MGERETITSKRFIAFFDIMGFKEMVMRENHDKILNMMKELKKFISSIESCYSGIPGKGGKIKTKFIEERVQTVLFSDSILIFTDSGTKEMAESLIYHCNLFIQYCAKSKIPIKGALSFGKFTSDFNQSIFLGQPLIDAFLLQEELQMYGAILDFNIERKLKELKFDFPNSNELIKYKAPTKSGKINHYCLNWVNDKDFKVKQSVQNIDNIYTVVSGKPRLYIDNTLDFLEHIIKLGTK
jgi:hypothetical protein